MEEEIVIKKNTEDIHEIITAVPSWILRWGILLVFAILISVILLSSLIQYPDVVKTNLRVVSLNAPKKIITKQSGRLITLLVKDGQMVKENQNLAFLETNGDPLSILKITNELKTLQESILNNNVKKIQLSIDLNLGELQNSFQTFYQDFLQYQSTQKNGYYLKKKLFLERDLRDIALLKNYILKQQKTQELEYLNQEEEYKAYQKLYKNKVISRSEFSQQENKFLSAKYPLQQSEIAILNNISSQNTKQKELLDLNHTITEERAKFIQSLNKCLTENNNWIMQYVLKASVSGKLSYSGIIQQNQNVMANQEIFIINPGNASFFGEIQIPQYNMGKIKEGAETLIKMRSYPFEQFGMIRGKLSFISDVPYRDSIFIARVRFDHFENNDSERKIIFKNGMQADAEIITQKSSLLQRFYRNISRMSN